MRDRAGRRGELSFEDVALVAVLSNAVDALGIALDVFAPHYDDLLATFQDNPEIGEAHVVLWLTRASAVVGDEARPPTDEAVAMIRIAPVVQRLVTELQSPAGNQLSLQLAEDATHRRGLIPSLAPRG